MPRALPTTTPANPSAPQSRSARTRARILAVSLELFNQRGEANVTTGHIADELDISPGNLYYHFRNKDAIIHELFAGFEKAIDIGPGEVEDPAMAMEDLWLYLHLMFERIWQYRFLYRNLNDLLMRDAKLKSHFNIIIGHKREAIHALCAALVEAGAMRASPRAIDMLTENILVIATFWLNYEHLSARRPGRLEAEQRQDNHLTHGVAQVMALVAPFLIGEAREHLDHLIDNYT
ncbi:MAG TPA: TetR/AcrR family transcriptional regulator [Usitatibacteraceae bacterium]|nr:TetR/AcrR family transcriptional regulator [Usitatibacteraceae bacterium]